MRADNWRPSLFVHDDFKLMISVTLAENSSTDIGLAE
jgi:hypothetical protein